MASQTSPHPEARSKPGPMAQCWAGLSTEVEVPKERLESQTLIELGPTTIRQHPAVRAWRKLDHARNEPEMVEVLKQKNKSAIYRLHGVGPGGRPIVAKRCLRETALLERRVYREILPRMGVPALTCHGFVAEPHSGFGWVFIQDASAEPYRAQDSAHRALLVSWLAALHTAGACRGPGGLPQRGSDHYLGQLRSARSRIQRHASNPALSRAELTLLDCLRSRLDFLESRWARLEALCQSLPKTLVHGDLKKKNLGVATQGGGLALLVFDWECAGWGMPGPDLVACPDLVCYHKLIREKWIVLPFEDIVRLQQAGTLFRTLAAIDWETWRLGSKNLERPMGNLRDFFAPQLTAVMQALGLH